MVWLTLTLKNDSSIEHDPFNGHFNRIHGRFVEIPFLKATSHTSWPLPLKYTHQDWSTVGFHGLYIQQASYCHRALGLRWFHSQRFPLSIHCYVYFANNTRFQMFWKPGLLEVTFVHICSHPMLYIYKICCLFFYRNVYMYMYMI